MKSESREMTSRTAKVVAKPIRNIPRSSPVPRGVFRLVEFGQDRLDASQKVQAGVGQRYRARGPDEQRDADFALQRRDRPRRSRLRNVQLTTGRGKASLAGDPIEQPQREEAVAHSEGG
jgi:hypothetical protein